jgi:hypothetical protein
MTTAPQAPMADVGEMYLVHTMMRREFNLLERAEAEATEIVAVMGEQHQAIAAAHDEAVHRLGDCCRFGRDGEGFATVLDDLVRVLTEHTGLEEKAALPLAEKSG